MTGQDGVEEIVVCFDDEGRNVVSEHRFQEFEAFTRRDESLDQYAASTVKASYVIVGSGLVVRGLVFFQFSVDEDGYVSSGFNLPLEYRWMLYETAAPARTLGTVPCNWHAAASARFPGMRSTCGNPKEKATKTRRCSYRNPSGVTGWG